MGAHILRVLLHDLFGYNQHSTFNISVNQQPTLYQRAQTPTYAYHGGAQSPEPYQSVTPLVAFNDVQIIDNGMYEVNMLQTTQNTQSVPIQQMYANKRRQFGGLWISEFKEK